MGFFEDLLKKDHVKNHPLNYGYKKARIDAILLKKHAQEVQEDDLMDEFSENNLKKKNPYDTGDKAPQDVLAAAFTTVRDMVAQFNWPMLPKVTFNNMKDVKKAANDESRIVSGIALFNLEFRTKTGVALKTTVPVQIVRGEVIPPSTFKHHNKTYIFAQSAVNELVKSHTIYKMNPLRGQFDPPLMKVDREQALAHRNMQGWDPVTHDLRTQRQVRMSRFKGIPVAYEAVKKDMDKAMDEGKDTFPKQYVNVLQNYILNHVNVAEYDQWYPALVNDGYVINQYGKAVNRGRTVNAQVSDVYQEAEYVRLSINEAKVELYHAKKERRFDEAEELEEELRQMEEYLRTLTTGHDLQAQMEEVEEYDLITDDESGSTDLGGVFYVGTKTPIEEGDAVKFMGYEGMIRGNVIEISAPHLIVKSKGVEYRVVAEDVLPLPQTFKKMYAGKSADYLPIPGEEDDGFEFEKTFRGKVILDEEDIDIWVNVLESVFQLEYREDFDIWEHEAVDALVLGWNGPSPEEVVELINQEDEE